VNLADSTKRFVAAYVDHVERAGGDIDAAPKWAQDRLDKLASGKLSAFPSPAAQDLDAYTRAHRNTVLLIEYLRRISGGGVGNAPVLEPVLATLIADALEQGWKRRTFTMIDSAYLLRLRNNIRTMLKAGDKNAETLALALDATLTKKATAADAIAAHLLGLSGPRAVNDLLYPRTGRHKKG